MPEKNCQRWQLAFIGRAVMSLIATKNGQPHRPWEANYILAFFFLLHLPVIQRFNNSQRAVGSGQRFIYTVAIASQLAMIMNGAGVPID